MKTCSRCKKTKSKQEFYRTGSYCKICYNNYKKRSNQRKRTEALNILKDMIKEGRLEL